MNKAHFRIAVVSSCLLFATTLYAQKPPIKFGKVNQSDLEMKAYAKDSAADAVVLADYGVSRMDYSTTEGFKLIFERHRRIKILQKSGYDWADGEILLYHQGGAEEEITGLKGYTYNLEGKEMVKSKLDKSGTFEEEYDENHKIIKFTMPNVKEGSVLEYAYTISSDFLFNFQDWEFQTTIPVIWSEYVTHVPEYYQYQIIHQGYLPFAVATTGTQDKSIQWQASNRDITTWDHTNIAYKVSNVDYQETIRRYVVQHAPAFESEPHMNSDRNYLQMVRYELAYEKWPRQTPINIMGTWEKLNSRYLESQYFGKPVKGSTFLKDELASLNLPEELTSRIAAIYNHVQQRVRWNGNNRRTLGFNLKGPYEEGIGSSAELNLLLTSMLQKAGIQADPVLISTRSHGVVRKPYPLVEQFNYVICKVTLEDRDLLLDATDPMLPMGVLPERCLNGWGWVVARENSGWLEIKPTLKKKTQIAGNLKIDESGNLSGKMAFTYDGYNAQKHRAEYTKKGPDDYIEDKIYHSDWEIDALIVENGVDKTRPFTEKYELEAMAGSERLGNTLYLNAVVSKTIATNPFISESRTYPINFSSPLEEIYYVTFEIPEGYSVTSQPENSLITLPNQAGKFRYQITLAGNKIKVLSKMSIDQTQFLPSEYRYIKEFFDQMLAKQKDQIVLQKT